MPHLAKIKAPFGQEKVFKEECTFSFDNPVSRLAILPYSALQVVPTNNDDSTYMYNYYIQYMNIA